MNRQYSSEPLPLALTMGDPAGIGGEISLKAWLDRKTLHDGGPFYLLGDPDHLAKLAAHLDLPVTLAEITDPQEAPGLFAQALPVFPVPLAASPKPGQPDAANAGAILKSVESAVAHCRSGQASGIVTNPISKAVLMDAGFRHPGHTEFLAELAKSPKSAIMMLACDLLRVIPVTVHCALKDAISSLTEELIVHTATTVVEALKENFGIEQPRLVMAGLNPHAGEEGKLGHEEIEILIPAAGRLRRSGIDISDPLPADSLFHPKALATYDAALCMYHDQALIPIKTIDFERGVNVTLGLPFIRTSPDHGTAFAIAGKGEASAESLKAALNMAAAMARQRVAKTISAP